MKDKERAMNIAMRLALPSDAAGILNIYAPFILNTPVTFELELPSVVDFTARVERIAAKYPYIVAEHDEEIVGFAYAGEQYARAAYQWNASLSVYIAPDFAGQGLGKALYGALLELLSLLGYRNFYGIITLPNKASMRLHAGMGFVQLCTMQNTGHKFGRWHDVALVEKAMGPYTAELTAPRCITEIAPDVITLILGKYSVNFTG